MPTPARRPDRASRRGWLLPAAGAAVLLTAGLWLVAPAVAGLLDDEPVLDPAAAASSATTSVPATSSAAPDPSTDPPSSAPSRATSPLPPSPGAQPSSPAPTTGEGGDTGQAPPEQTWRPVAEGFASNFATPGQDWAQRLAAWTTPELAAAYVDTDPTRQPSARLQDLEVTEEGPTSLDVLATYADTGAGDLAVELQVLLTPEGWRVSSASPTS